MFLLDTNVVSELRKARSGRADTRVIAWADSVRAADMFLSVVSVLELEIGVLQMERRNAPQGAILRAWMNGHVLPAFHGRILVVDVQVMLRCAALNVPSRSSDRDMLIAATGIVHGMTIVTRNIAHFKATGAQLLNPWKE